MDEVAINQLKKKEEEGRGKKGQNSTEERMQVSIRVDVIGVCVCVYVGVHNEERMQVSKIVHWSYTSAILCCLKEAISLCCWGMSGQ